jgi:hypothetical protein
MAMSPIGERAASISLDDARTDYLRFIRTMAIREQLADQGYRNADPLEIAERTRPCGSRLQKMFAISPEVFGQAQRQMERNVPIDAARLRDGLFQKAPLAIGGIGTWGSALAPFAQASVAFLQSLSPFSSFDRILNAFAAAHARCHRDRVCGRLFGSRNVIQAGLGDELQPDHQSSFESHRRSRAQ